MREFNFHRKRKRVPKINTTATADISFMLLVFFLVTTSLDNERGLTRQMPPPADSTQVEQMDVKREDMMKIVVDAENRVTCDGKIVDMGLLKHDITRFVEQKPKRHVIAICCSPKADYEHYFNVQHTVAAAYREMREQLARKLYGKSLARCGDEEKKQVYERLPQRVSDRVDEEADRENEDHQGKEAGK